MQTLLINRFFVNIFLDLSEKRRDRATKIVVTVSTKTSETLSESVFVKFANEIETKAQHVA